MSGVDVRAPYVLREYAVIADGERGALIGPRGDCAWMCFPSWESEAVFSGLLGGRGGYVVRPDDEWQVWGGYYEKRSLIWRSRWVTRNSVVECREALARPAGRNRAVLLRQMRAIQGPARIHAHLDVHAEFGARRMTGVRLDGDVWTARSGPVRLRWHGAEGAAESDGGLSVEFKLMEGQLHDFVLELTTGPPEDQLLDARELWAATVADWHESVPSCEDTLAPRDAQLAYAVLTGLTSASGGMVAAATTSLPEHMGDIRNYDYRYAWIRDQCYAALAVAEHGGRLALLDSGVGFVTDRLLDDRDQLRPAYTAAGAPVPGPQARDDLPGYPGSNVMVGNRAANQFQLDVFGEALQLFAAAAAADRLPKEAERAVRIAVDAIGRHHARPDAGVWETEPRMWTHSKLACVAGLRSAAATMASPAETGEWLALAESLLADTTRTSISPAGHWQRAPDDERIDASLLIPPVRGALPPDDPRTAATLRAVQEQLVDDGFVYRYQVDQRPLGHAEGAFMLCGFLLALAEHHQGQYIRASSRFERIRSGCSTTGLFTEEYDIRQRQLRGNLPQAFVHALLLETATRLGNVSEG